MEVRTDRYLLNPEIPRPRVDTTTGPHDEAPLTSKHRMVSVVDDNESVRESLPDLLQQAGYAVQAFSSAEAFIVSGAVDDTGCLILDVGLPGMSGPDLQRELRRRGKAIPIVFITAQGDKSLGPRLIAHGAVACLFKPFSDTALLEAVETALGTREA
jgi:FixJ family two-component response regulator